MVDLIDLPGFDRGLACEKSRKLFFDRLGHAGKVVVVDHDYLASGLPRTELHHQFNFVFFRENEMDELEPL